MFELQFGNLLKFYLHGAPSVQLGFSQWFSLLELLVKYECKQLHFEATLQFLNLRFRLNLNVCPVVCKIQTVCKNASQMKVRLVTLKESAMAEKDKRLRLWPGKGIEGEGTEAGRWLQIIEFRSHF